MKQRTIAILFSTLFFLFLALPGLGALTGMGRQSEEDILWSELRKKWPFGVSSPRAFNRWFEDNIGWRGSFFSMHEALIYGIFGQSPREGRVRIGRNGFLYLGDDFFDVFSRHAGTKALGRKEMEAAANSYAALVTTLEKLDIPTLIVIAPDKPTVYPENLPSWVQAPRAALSEEWGRMLPGGAHFLAPALLRAKEEWAPRLIYLKEDTHWNSLGSYAAYRDIIASIENLLKRQLARHEAVEVKDILLEGIHPDLARFMYLRRPYATFNLDFTPPLRTECQNVAWPDPESTDRIFECKGALNDLEVLFIHDSFLGVNHPLYESTFSKLITMHITSLDAAANNETATRLLREGKVKPDLVVIMLVERTIAAHAPKIDSFTRKLAADPAATAAQ